jgi:hypothetical protein
MEGGENCRPMGDDGSTREPPTGTSPETDRTAVESLGSSEHRDGRRALVRDVVLLALVAASPVVQLLSARRVAWAILAVAALGVAAVGVAVVVRRPFAAVADWHRQLAVLATTAFGTLCVTWVVFVLEPGAVRFASASLGTLVGAFVARLARVVDGRTPTGGA